MTKCVTIYEREVHHGYSDDEHEPFGYGASLEEERSGRGDCHRDRNWGSAARRAGSHLVIDADGNFAEAVSGGCVEGAVIASGEAKMLEFEVADETAWRVGLSCGGRICIYVERLD